MQYNLIISGTIGSWYNSCSVDYVRYVLANNKDKDVHVGFCSLGGFVKDGLEMHQAFRDHGKVHAHAFGMNASISTVAMLGCASIDIVKGSFFLIHNVSALIDKYESQNKEQLDEFIKKLQSDRDTLRTFDDVLATMYADKTGKTVDECAAQMKKGNWMTAQQAVDFGLVDSIREDKDAEQAANQYTDNFTNSYHNFKDHGLPPLPDDSTDSISAKTGAGDPTHSSLQKTRQWLKSLIPNSLANNHHSMIKVFNAVATLLACADGFKPQDDGTIAFTQEQMKTIDDKLAENQKTLSDNQAAMKAAAESIKKLKDEKEKLEEQIKNLKEGPATDPDGHALDKGNEAFTAQDLFNIVKEV